MEAKKMDDIIVPIETAKIQSFVCVEEVETQGIKNHFWKFRFLVSLDNGIVGQYFSDETNQKMLKKVFGFILLLIAGKMLLGK